MDVVEAERFLVQDRRLAGPPVFPCGGIAVGVIVAHCFTLWSLELLTEVPSAGFIALQRVHAHQLAEFQKVRNTSRILEGLVEFLTAPENRDILPEFLAQFRNPRDSPLEAGFVTRHATFIPEELAEFAMEGCDRP